MSRKPYDPVYLSSLRELKVLLAVFVVALTYTIVFSLVFSYGRTAAEVRDYFGIPDWVLWGVFVPWLVCIAFTVWFCFVFMKIHDPPPPSARASDSPTESHSTTESGEVARDPTNAG